MIIITFVLLLAFINSADAASKAFGNECTNGTDSCGTGQICKVDGGTNKCLCDTTNHWIVNNSSNGCICDTTNHWIVNNSSNGCMCEAAKHYVANSAGSACECSTGYTGTSCKAKIGTACAVISDCADANANCTSGKLCDCNAQFKASTDSTSCIVALDSGAAGLIVSMVTLIGCLLISKLE